MCQTCNYLSMTLLHKRFPKLSALSLLVLVKFGSLHNCKQFFPNDLNKCTFLSRLTGETLQPELSLVNSCDSKPNINHSINTLNKYTNCISYRGVRAKQKKKKKECSWHDTILHPELSYQFWVLWIMWCHSFIAIASRHTLYICLCFPPDKA